MSSGNMYFYISVCSTHTSNMFSSPTLSGQLVENLYVQNEKKKEKKQISVARRSIRKRRSRRKKDITRRDSESRCTRQTGSCTASCTARLLPVIVLLIVVVVVVAVAVVVAVSGYEQSHCVYATWCACSGCLRFIVVAQDKTIS